MNIEKYHEKITSELMDLLLSADPDRSAVCAYLPNSSILTCKDMGSLVSTAVLTESRGIFELKNIAVLETYRGRGIAKLMIEEIKNLARELGAKYIEVGTGNSSLSQLALYQKCGFRMHGIVSDFFDSYPEPIYENGIRCIDMVRLRAKL